MKLIKPAAVCILVMLVACVPQWALAANGEIALFSLNDGENGQELSIKLQILVMMTLLGFL
ncbi:hypothetical protein NE541_16235, partial [Coprococcus eutactus]